jgi:uncharacterized membrane-anchored protein
MEYLSHWQFWLAVVVVSIVASLVMSFVFARIGGLSVNTRTLFFVLLLILAGWAVWKYVLGK